MNEFLENLKAEAAQNPLAAMGAVAAMFVAFSKVVQAYGQSSGSRAYAKQVNAKLKKSK